ncbi:MAG TPA: carboxypeptidase regulatory-like domain-containing protein, partial [Alphaproteobacteria bacterium]
TVDELGEYRFEDVPLTIGNNQVRIVLYGPQGQVQERIENYQISGGMARPGETNFTAGAVDSDHQLIRLVPKKNPGLVGVAANAYVAHGLSKEVTVFGSTSKLPTQEGEKKYVTAGAMGTFLNSLGQAELYKEIGGGQAVDLRLVTKLLGLRLNMQSAFFNKFESPDAGFGTNAKKFESEIRANTGFKTPFGNLGLQLSARHRKNVTGLPTSDVSFQQTLGLSGVNLTQETSSSFIDFNHQSSSGKMSATVRLRQWQIRGQLDYNLHPLTEFSGINGEVRYTDQDGFSAAVNAQHNFLSRSQGVGAQVGYDFGKFLGSVDVAWVKERGVEVTLRASTSLGPYGRDGRYIMSSKKMSRSTPVQGHVFLDHDGNNAYSEGDEPIPESQLLVGGRGTPETADEEGYVIANTGGEGQVVNVEVNKSTLADPYYMPGLPGYSTVLRPGSMPKFDLPVIETGAIDGTVYRDNGDPISGMRLELVDEGGAVIKTTDTAYDGFYTFEFVPPGTYSVRADPSYGVNVPPETVTVASDDLFNSGIDLQLLEQVEEAEAVDGVEEGDEPSTAPDSDTESGRVAHTYHERSNGTLQPAPLSTEGDLSAFVKRVRIGEHPDTVRLVLDLSGPIVYRMGFADGGKTLTIDLPDVGWQAMQHWRGTKTPVIESFDAEALPEGGTRLVIRGKGLLASGLNGVLEPQNGQGYRLFLDLMTP